MLGKRIINTATGAAPSACTTDTVQILDGVPFQSIATYQLDGDANDLTTNHNGTWVGTEAYTTGQFGQAGVFNGSSSYIDTNISTITSNGGSVSLWVKTTTGTQSAFFGGQSPSQNRFYFGVRNNSFWIGAGSAQNSYNISASSLLDGNWHHVVLTLDGSTAKYYLDGNSTPVDTLSYTSAGTIGVTPLIGAIDATGTVSAYTNGSIDQVRIYNKALSAANVSTLYAETLATASTNPTFNAPSCVAYYKMSDATDETGSYDGTPTDVNFNVAGKFGNAGEFNGSSSKIITSADFDGSTSGGSSISFWFNTTQTTAKALFGSNTIQGGASQGSTVYLGAASGSIADESISFWDFNGSTTSVFYAKGGSTYYQDGNWHHCTIISSSSSKEIWIDGQSQTVYYFSSGSVSANAKLTDITIGDDNTGGGFNFDGKIDQVRIFNRAITSNEVETLYDEVQCIPTIVPTDYFEPVIYAGNGTTQSISSLDFQPDLVWIKSRFAIASHSLQDTVRGAGQNYNLYSDNTAYEGQYGIYGYLSSFDTNGFEVIAGAYGDHSNKLGEDYVAWNWKAADTTTTIAAGTVGNTIASDVRASVDAGFSIVTYTGNGLSNQTIGHGLGKTPDMIITKGRANLSTYDGWDIWHKDLTLNYIVALQSTSAEAFAGVDQRFVTSLNSDTVFGLGPDIYGPNSNGTTKIAYAFHSVDGYSKIGSYVGTGTAGNSIVTGFRPAFVMVKRTDSTGAWLILDNVRNTTNPRDKFLMADSSAIEGTADGIIFSSNGFTFTNVHYNNSGATFIFLAFAEEVFNPNGVTRNATDPFGDSSEVAFYKFEDNANDAEGSYNGTASNVTYATGYIYKAALFNGSSSYIQADGIFSSSPSVMSASVWFRTTSDGNILDIGDNSVSLAQNRIFFSSGLLYVTLNGGDGGFATTSATGLQDGNWHHIVAVWDDGSVTDGIKMYIDGATTPTAQADSTQSFNSALDLFIGANDNSAEGGTIRQYFNGGIDQVRIFNRALDSGEVTQLYNE